MAQYTINALLSMQKALLTRRNQLNELKNNSALRTRFFNSGTETKIEEPTYDVKKVDAKMVNINSALFTIDQKIKESNAIIRIDIDVNFQELSSAIE